VGLLRAEQLARCSSAQLLQVHGCCSDQIKDSPTSDTAAVFRADESIAPHLPVNKRNYMFGGVAAAAAQFAIWLLPDVQVLLHMLCILRHKLTHLDAKS